MLNDRMCMTANETINDLGGLSGARCASHARPLFSGSLIMAKRTLEPMNG